MEVSEVDAADLAARQTARNRKKKEKKKESVKRKRELLPTTADAVLAGATRATADAALAATATAGASRAKLHEPTRAAPSGAGVAAAAGWKAPKTSTRDVWDGGVTSMDTVFAGALVTATAGAAGMRRALLRCTTRGAPAATAAAEAERCAQMLRLRCVLAGELPPLPAAFGGLVAPPDAPFEAV